MAEANHSGSRSLKLGLLAAAIVGSLCIVMGELAVRFLSPQMSEYPRSAFSPEYGLISYPNDRIVHEVPGQWRFHYTTNRYGHRGAEVPVSNVYPVPNVVVLGDSFTFGSGVNDGAEYPAVMRRAFAGRAEVVNLSSRGWGLTQEIRRFYELGQLYQPKAVVVQFTANDPADNVFNPVTTVHEGRFQFRDSENRVEGFKKYLSRSLLQKSQLYNLVRSALYDRLRQGEVAAAMENRQGAGGTVSEAERFHAELLATFARDLKSKGIPLLMIAVPLHLPRFPHIAARTRELHAAGLLRYIDIMDLAGENALAKSPEGHWPAALHRTVGEHLAAIIERDYLARR